MWCAFGLPIALFLEYYNFTHPLMGFDLLVPAVLEYVMRCRFGAFPANNSNYFRAPRLVLIFVFQHPYFPHHIL